MHTNLYGIYLDENKPDTLPPSAWGKAANKIALNQLPNAIFQQGKMAWGSVRKFLSFRKGI